MIRTKILAEKKRSFSTGQLKVDCGYAIKLKALHTTIVARKSSSKTDSVPCWDRTIAIVESKTQHTNKCNPGGVNRVVTAQRSGLYTDCIPEEAVYSMCSHVDDGFPLTTQAITQFLRPHWPQKKPITKQNIFYVRIKVMRMMNGYHPHLTPWRRLLEKLMSSKIVLNL